MPDRMPKDIPHRMSDRMPEGIPDKKARIFAK